MAPVNNDCRIRRSSPIMSVLAFRTVHEGEAVIRSLIVCEHCPNTTENTWRLASSLWVMRSPYCRSCSFHISCSAMDAVAAGGASAGFGRSSNDKLSGSMAVMNSPAPFTERAMYSAISWVVTENMSDPLFILPTS